jgi:tRNA 2-thiocytidine biosynthesis protein TtcA
MRPIGRAISDFDMIRHDDRILLGVSGGKDSLSLLHILVHLQKYSPVAFELGAITVDPQVEGFDPSPLRPYMESLSVPYFYEKQPLMERASQHMKKDSFCSWCARMKRGVMYATARRERYNVLALAQHLDDLAESFLMSVFHAGQLRTMKAHYRIDAGDLRVIRPLVYVRERQTHAYARAMRLPIIGDNCPACFRMPTERMHMKRLLAGEETGNRLLFKRILSTIKPLMNG